MHYVFRGPDYVNTIQPDEIQSFVHFDQNTKEFGNICKRKATSNIKGAVRSLNGAEKSMKWVWMFRFKAQKDFLNKPLCLLNLIGSESPLELGLDSQKKILLVFEKLDLFRKILVAIMVVFFWLLVLD